MISTELLEQSKRLIHDCDVVIVGAGAGLSTAAGLHYSGKRFTDNFPDYISKYQLTDMYSSAFYPFQTLEEKWGYFSRHIKLNRFDAEVGLVYKNLKCILDEKEHFVITTNGDDQFFRAGFDPENVFATQGHYNLFQCKVACHDTLYENEEMVNQMVEQQKDCKIPTELIPTCPVCGGELVAHLRMDQYFVENEDWHKASQRYQQFLQSCIGKKVVFLELGIGFNTPSIIRWPFEKMVVQFNNSYLIRVNMDNVQPSYDIQDKGVLIEGDIAEFVEGIH